MTIIFVAILGLIFGSFGTMLIYRLPRQESIGGRSRCPACKSTIAWHDLIPVVSFILLLGRCRACKRRISAHYPLLECMTSLLFVGLFLHLYDEPIFVLVPTIIAAYAALLIAFHDAATQRIPDILTIIVFFSALVARIVSDDIPNALRDAFMGAGIPFLFFGALFAISRGRWVGSGDMLLGAALGLLLGIQGSILMLFLAYILGAAVSIVLLAMRKIDRKGAIAFGPFLVAGAMLSLFFGDKIIAAYVGMLMGG